MKKCWLLILFFTSLQFVYSQNVGIGTNFPQAKLHVNGDLRLQYGDKVNSVSNDTTLAEGGDSALATQVAIKKYVTSSMWAGGFQTVPTSISDLTHIAQCGGEPLAMFVEDNYAYVVKLEGNFCIFDVSNPLNVIVKSNVPNKGGGYTTLSEQLIYVQGNYAYLADRNFRVFDVSNKTNVIFKDSVTPSGGGAIGVVVKSNFAYVLSTGGLTIFDVSDPNNITTRGVTSTNLNNPVSIHVRGNYAYVGSAGNSRLCIFDISNPDNIVARGYLDGVSSRYLAIEDNYAYTFCSTGLCIYDISNPDNIVFKGSVNTGLTGIRAIKVLNKFVYLLTYMPGKIYYHDATFPGNIIPKGSKLLWDQATCMYLKNNYFYVGNFSPTGWDPGGFTVAKINSKPNTFQRYDNGVIQSVPYYGWVGNDSVFYAQKERVGIGTTNPSEKLTVVGNITATGTITSSSDIRYKTNLTPVINVLSAVNSIQPLYYNWKTDFRGYTPKRQLGLSAQEIEKYFPEIVQTDRDGYKAVDYARMTPVLVQAIKEQQQQLQQKEERLRRVEADNAVLRSRLERLEKLLSKPK